MIVRLCGGVPVYVSLAANDGFSLLPERVRQKISSRTKAVMYASPNNPTGRVLPFPVLAELAEISKAHNLLVLAIPAVLQAFHVPITWHVPGHSTLSGD